ncbi:2-oxo acid dehydrogenase subunit E2 [Leucobacter viscericola]|uniref:Dihydrolipoamide acetyltransferase component of pyruvate dehydrogenase complex n=1 Tax=Leucobacter viscericola TaxID=2714935 RepID=A0A6G7XGA1_9MICO|nr:dihydrolipoamide acetyltransferase family protein [Leucobacter viscericola]QIK63532.1 2-oxo acid dehydrogenase subunit E2 [Leucobacter viscericola]
MTTQVFRLPDLGEGLTEAALVRWMVAVGDTIKIDQAIAEVETAKSIVELPSPYAGTVIALHGEEGDTILTGAPVLEVSSGVEPGAGTAAGSATMAGSEASERSHTNDEHEAYRKEEQAGSGNVLIGYGTGAGPAKGRRKRRGAGAAPRASREGAGGSVASAGSPAPDEGVTPESSTTTSRTVAVRSPIVRRLARELGIDPRSVEPTGLDGAVTRADVLRAAEAGSAAPAAAAEAPGSGSAAIPNQHPTGPLKVLRTERFTPLRKAVSAKLSRSRAEIPEATVWVDVDLTEVWELRPRMASEGEKPPSLTALFARYTLLALEQYPLLASRLSASGDEIQVFDGVSLGIAVDTDRGLMVPVIHRADALSVSALDGSLRELSRVAREGRTPPEQLRDSTFTLNNYGGFGVDGSAAIINHPEVALLGIGRVLERPWVVDGQIVPRRIAQLSLVFDHRVCDGGYAAGFLRAVVDLLEHPLRAYPLV